MKFKLPILACVWLALVAAEAPAKNNDQMWAEYQSALTGEGITRPMFDQAMLWTELQYHLGLCRAYLGDDDVAFWRQWWNNTSLKSGPYGRKILTIGDNQYYAGFQDARKKPLTKIQCQRVLDNWFNRMQTSVDTRRK
jgi:hypothetical protein